MKTKVKNRLKAIGATAAVLLAIPVLAAVGAVIWLAGVALSYVLLFVVLGALALIVAAGLLAMLWDAIRGK